MFIYSKHQFIINHQKNSLKGKIIFWYCIDHDGDKSYCRKKSIVKQ